MKTTIKFCLMLITTILITGCKKDWLEEKQNIKLIVPSKLSDLELLMNTSLFSKDGRGAMEASCDDFEVTEDQFNSLWYDFNRKLVTWSVDEFPKLGAALYEEEWEYPYAQIQSCNVTLKALEKIERTEANALVFDRVKGTALYHRARAFLNLAMTFCKYYDSASADQDLGIPLKLDEDINEPIFRSSLKQTYQRILQDLILSATLLPKNPISRMHITNAGAYALLARTYLYMNDFQKAFEAADNSLKLYSILDDYTTFNASDTYPLSFKSKEVHIEIPVTAPYSTSSLSSSIPVDLYNQYSEFDLRKKLYFKIQNGKVIWRGSLITNELGGTATNEIMLIGAESAVRLGNRNTAMDLLNSLLKTRYSRETFVPFTANSDSEALDIILKERRKELLKRGLRFQDLKRLNRDPRYAKTLKRGVGDKIYSLPPNDKRYVFPIPQYIINYNGIEQN